MWLCNIGQVLYRDCGIWHTSVFFIDLATLTTWLHLFDWLTRVNWTNLVVLARSLALCLEAPVSHALKLSKGGCALRSVIFGTAACI